MSLLLLAAVIGCIGGVQPNEEWHFTGINVALNKVTTQLPETYTKGESQLAVDGRRDADWKNNTCTHTMPVFKAPASWSVELNRSYIIKGIRIYNRDVFRERLDNFKIIGSPTGTTLYDDSIVQNKLARQLIISIPVSETTAFSNITIKIPANEGQSILTLCEVELYAAFYVCPIHNFGDQVRWNIRQGTGYLNVDRDLVSYQAIIDFTCTPNSALVGSASVTCLLDGRYSTIVPTCMPYVCPFKTSDANLEWKLNQATGSMNSGGLVSSGTIINFGCKQNYTLVGVATVECLPNGMYSASLPWCNYIKCDAPGDINNGHYTQPLYSDYSAGETVEWECLDGYASMQNKTRQCQNSSKWSGSEVACLQNSCSFPNGLYNVTLTFPNGSDFVLGNVAFNTYVTVHCDEGFTSNVKAITCTISTEWDYLPSCLQIYCDRIAKPATGVYIYLNENTNELCNAQRCYYGTVAVSLCDERATRYVGGERKCGENGRWSNQDNTCGKPESSEQSALAPAAVGGITAGTFVVGMAAGFAVACFLGAWRRRIDTPADKPNSRDSAYCTPMEARPEDPNYEQLNEGTRNNDNDTYDQLNVQSTF